MTKQAFKIEGDFQMGRIRQHFTVEMVGVDEADARDHTFKDIGSRHGVPRRLIDITTVTPISLDEASDITRQRIAKE